MVEDDTTRDPATHDAQRDLEQRALRNVRGLVDSIEAEEHGRRRFQKWALGLLVAAVALLAAFVLITSSGRSGGDREIVVSPASKSPAR